jgi:GDP-D-mannose dehydratase
MELSQRPCTDFLGVCFQAMWMMLQLEKPEDFVVCTGEQHSVREFVEKAFKHIDEEIRYASRELLGKASPSEWGYD